MEEKHWNLGTGHLGTVSKDIYLRYDSGHGELRGERDITQKGEGWWGKNTGTVTYRSAGDYCHMYQPREESVVV